MNTNENNYSCAECEGKGFRISNYDVECICNKCKGYGKLNWIENIFGCERIINPITIQNIKEYNMTLNIRKEIEFLLHTYTFDQALQRIEEKLRGMKSVGKIYSYNFQRFKIDYLNSEGIEISAKVCKYSEEYHVRFDVKDLRR